MTAHTRSMAACLEDAERELRPNALAIILDAFGAILVWRRAKACRDQRLAMQIEDDKTLDELEQIEHETRLAARSACEAVGIDWRTLGEL
ncbi:MAG: hypothetical protein CMG78_09455 [Marinobacter sp.]|nr:hypothetical protein [Marinobacter sp.]